jgi:hypothetical protein
MFRKVLVVGIIFLFIGISIIPKTIAYSNTKSLDVNENITTNTKLLPDIIIERVYIYRGMTDWGEYYLQFGCIVKNIGLKTTGSYWFVHIDVDVYEARIFSPDNYQGHHDGGLGSSDPLDPGESEFIGFYDNYWNPDFVGFFLRFECQCSCDFEEKNTDNNYLYKTYFRFFGWLFPLPILF